MAVLLAAVFALPAYPKAGDEVVKIDFDDGTVCGFETYTEGGACSLENDNGALAVKITSCGHLDYANQAYWDGFSLVQGVTYQYSFDISCSIGMNPSAIHLYIGSPIGIAYSQIDARGGCDDALVVFREAGPLTNNCAIPVHLGGNKKVDVQAFSPLALRRGVRGEALKVNTRLIFRMAFKATAHTAPETAVARGIESVATCHQWSEIAHHRRECVLLSKDMVVESPLVVVGNL